MSVSKKAIQAAAGAGGAAESDYIFASRDNQIITLDHTTAGSLSVAGTYSTTFFAFSLDVTPDNAYMAHVTSNPNIFIYDISNPASISLESTYSVGTQDNYPFPHAGRFSKDGSYFAVGHQPRDIRVYSFSSGTLTHVTSYTCADETQCLDWSPDGDYIMTGGETDGSVQLLSFNGSTLANAATYNLLLNNDRIGVEFSPDGAYVACINQATSASVELLNRSGSTLSSAAVYSGSGSCQSLNWHPEGDYLVVGLNQSPFVALLDHTTPGSLSLAASYAAYTKDDGEDIRFTASGQYIAVCGGTAFNGGVTLLDHTTAGSLSFAAVYSTTVVESNFRGLTVTKAE